MQVEKCNKRNIRKIFGWKLHKSGYCLGERKNKKNIFVLERK